MTPDNTEPHLAYQLRRLADSLANTPNRNTSQRHAERLLTAGVLLWTRGASALAKSEQWAGPWSTGASGPTGKGGHSDPTASAACAELEPDRPAHDTDDDAAAARRRGPGPESRYHQRLTQAVSFAVDNATEIATVILAVHQHGSAARPTDECAEPRCTDTAEPGRKGRCTACAKWRQRWLAHHPGSTWADVPPVPASVIDERRIGRRRRSA